MSGTITSPTVNLRGESFRVRDAVAEFSHQRTPGVVYGPENGGWVGFYLPFPVQAVIDDEQVRQGKVIGNPSRAALQVMHAMAGAIRPNEFDLTPSEIEVVEIIKAAFAAVYQRKVILNHESGNGG